MRILCPDNSTFDMNVLPDLGDDLRYCVLDYSNQQDVDFFFIPLVFLDQVSCPAADLRIGRYRIQVPLDWSIVIVDKDVGNLEILDLVELHGRPFDAFLLNPIHGYMPSFGEIGIENLFPNVAWTLPKLKFGHILAVPLDTGPKPTCAFFVRDKNRLPEQLDIRKVFS